MKAQATIQAGVCGFITKVTVESPSMFEPAAVVLNTNCEKIAGLGKAITQVNGLDEIKLGFEGKIMSEARRVLSS